MEARNGDRHDEAGSEKPVIELFIRASSIDRTQKGGAPFCQQWNIAFRLLDDKDLISLRVTNVNLEDPPAAYEDLDVTRRLPVCRVIRGFINGEDYTGHVCETNDEIELLLERLNVPSLLMSKEPSVANERRRAERVFEDLYRHLGQFLRTPNDNGSLLLSDLRRLNDFLDEKRTRFLLADEPSFVDCVLMPRLQHVRVVGAAYRQLEIPADLIWLWRYMAAMYTHKAFAQSCPLDRDVLAVYETKVPVGGTSTKFMRAESSVDVPDAVFDVLEARQRGQAAATSSASD